MLLMWLLLAAAAAAGAASGPSSSHTPTLSSPPHPSLQCRPSRPPQASLGFRSCLRRRHRRSRRRRRPAPRANLVLYSYISPFSAPGAFKPILGRSC
uniref:Secreted protein n=1 Tax=Physcomitrium patens TaxID=3218 RepID=A0A2K1JUV6_PHYPA|nr:hypothetical protein PHYPA_015067 [Physcomitrium patens]